MLCVLPLLRVSQLRAKLLLLIFLLSSPLLQLHLEDSRIKSSGEL